MDHPVFLRRGSHVDPDDGVCLMEYVAVLAGERFSDTPSCTEPVLAMLARFVNDALPDDARQHLIEFAPRLVGARGVGPWVSSDIVVAALDRVLAADGLAWWRRVVMREHRRRAARRSDWLRRTWSRGTGMTDDGMELLYRCGPANVAFTRALAAAHRLPGPRYASVPIVMLDAGIRVTGEHDPVHVPYVLARI